MKTVRYAVVGLGHIAQVAILPAFKNAANSKLAALVSDDRKKAGALRKKYRAEAELSYKELPAFLEAGKVDAVYISLPNDQHYHFAKMALGFGVHVLCEKPFTLDARQAYALSALANRRRLKLMVAYRLHFDAANLKAIEIAQGGAIGDLRYFTSQFSLQVTNRSNIRLQAKHGGGPLWDIGIYCINAARYLFRAEPIDVTAFAERGERGRFQEVDEMTSVVLRFPGNRLCSFTCSFGAAEASEYFVYGTKGHVRLQGAYDYATPRKLEARADQGKTRVYRYAKADQFGPELVHFSDCVLHDRRPLPSAREGAMDIRVIAAALESIRTRRAVRIRSGPSRVVRPLPQHKIHRAPFQKPVPIRAKSPQAG